MKVINWTNDRIIFERSKGEQVDSVNEAMDLFSSLCEEWNLDTVETTNRGGLLLRNDSHGISYEVSKCKVIDYFDKGKCVVRGFPTPQSWGLK